MKREIKFRAWDEEDNKMIEWHDEFFYDTSEVTQWSGDFSYITMPLMPYTGLKDKNGVEIYEGDILKDDTKHIKKVFFQHGTFGCYAKKRKSFYTEETIDIFYSLLEYILGDVEIEVIGNIYENPDLLNQ